MSNEPKKEAEEEISILIMDSGEMYLEMEAFIRFLRSDADVKPEDRSQAIALKSIADFLEEKCKELREDKANIDDVFKNTVGPKQ